MKWIIYCLLLDKRKKQYIDGDKLRITCLFFGGGIDSDKVSRK